VDPHQIQQLVDEYVSHIAVYEVAVSRAKVTKSDKKRLLAITDAEIAFRAAQAVKKQLKAAGVEIKRSV
jgi:coproporphyrinogen III oxidase-like Fe-S oxidoreductase